MESTVGEASVAARVESPAEFKRRLKEIIRA